MAFPPGRSVVVAVALGASPVADKGLSNVNARSGAEVTLQAMEYVCANLAGHLLESSSSECGDAVTEYGSKARLPLGRVDAPIDAITGLMPHDSDVNDAVAGSDRLPSLSTTVIVAAQLPAETSATNEGVGDVTDERTDALAAGRLSSDHT